MDMKARRTFRRSSRYAGEEQLGQNLVCHGLLRDEPDAKLSALEAAYFRASGRHIFGHPGSRFLARPGVKNRRILGTIFRPQNKDHISVPFNKTKGNKNVWSLFSTRNLILKLGPFLVPKFRKNGL